MATKNIHLHPEPGTTEYFCGMGVTASGDTLEIEFENAFILDDMVVGSLSDNYKVELVYPASGVTCTLRGSESGTFEMNGYSSHKKWYRIPTNGKLKLTTTSYSSNSFLKTSIVGREAI
jgi:hypothetical protein